MILGSANHDPTAHLQLDNEEECLDDDDFIGVCSVGEVVCNDII